MPYTHTRIESGSIPIDHLRLVHSSGETILLFSFVFSAGR